MPAHIYTSHPGNLSNLLQVVLSVQSEHQGSEVVDVEGPAWTGLHLITAVQTLELAGRRANRGPFVVIRKQLISSGSAISEGRDTNY